jgi:hypothetical protein
MARTARLVRYPVLAWLAWALWLVGCNDLLDINQPAKQLLQNDAGSIALRDSGAFGLDPSPPAFVGNAGDSSGMTSAPAASSGGGSGASKTDDAGAEDAGTSSGSPYVWANWPMPNPVATNLPNPQGYATLAKGRVADKVTHLEWQQFSDDQTRTWSDAVAYCTGLMLGGDGWRLPSRIELLSLLDFTSPSIAMDTQTFAGAPADSYWSSSPFIGAKSSAWGVNFAFHDGFVFTDDVSQPHRVRCVR